MKSTSITIGREADNQIVLNDPTDVTSRHHAVLVVMSNGKMTITDQSANGTYINGQRISSNVPVPVTRKDTVSFAHQCTLDWDRVPKTGGWITYLIIGLIVAALVVLGVIFGPKLFKPQEPVEPATPGIVTDSVNDNGKETTAEPGVDCTITFDANGGQGTMGPQKVLKNASAGLIANTFTREHYVFTGWNTEANGNGTSYADKDPVTLPYDNLTLYAQWEEKTYTVKFVQNDKKVGGEMTPFTVKEGQESTLPPNTFTKKGYEFKGWNTQPNGKGEAYPDMAVINPTSDLTLYAQWKKKSANVQEEKPVETQPEEVTPQEKPDEKPVI